MFSSLRRRPLPIPPLGFLYLFLYVFCTFFCPLFASLCCPAYLFVLLRWCSGSLVVRGLRGFGVRTPALCGVWIACWGGGGWCLDGDGVLFLLLLFCSLFTSWLFGAIGHPLAGFSFFSLFLVWCVCVCFLLLFYDGTGRDVYIIVKKNVFVRFFFLFFSRFGSFCGVVVYV